jgi:asparagine synthase (glutamine-hydrolysing)
MCGIFAYITNDKDIDRFTNIYNSTFIEKQFNKGKKRGPESSTLKKIINDKCIFLGFHRLAINGLDDISNQPICIDGIYLICNGEIYNYRALFNKLMIKNQTNSDCEIIIHIYKLYGIDYLFEMIDGVFSFVLYDSNIQRTYVARDPYGVRPLYCYNNGNEHVFASELKQIHKFGANVKQFQPGSYHIVGGETKRYHSFGFSKMIYNNIYDIYGIVYQTLFSAVKKRVVTTERPIACLLSGGLDSSTIAALVKSCLPKETVLETYSIGLKGSTDLQYAQMVAEHIGSKHTNIVLTEDEFFDAIPETIKAIESYDTTTVRASVGNYLIGKYIAEHSDAKVIFNGDGSDELTGGYIYMNKCPNETEFDCECKRLLTDIHLFDVLRSDKCISSHGLEPRTPFLDRSFVQVYLSIPDNLRCQKINNFEEKFFLRNSIDFMNNCLLPEEVLWRKKEAFSDGVSSLDKPWYKVIQEKVNNLDIVKSTSNHLPPQTPEQTYYRCLFESFYPNCSEIVPYFWMPKYVKASDPSARTLFLKDGFSNN